MTFLSNIHLIPKVLFATCLCIALYVPKLPNIRHLALLPHRLSSELVHPRLFLTYKQVILHLIEVRLLVFLITSVVSFHAELLLDYRVVELLV